MTKKYDQLIEDRIEKLTKDSSWQDTLVSMQENIIEQQYIAAGVVLYQMGFSHRNTEATLVREELADKLKISPMYLTTISLVYKAVKHHGAGVSLVKEIGFNKLAIIARAIGYDTTKWKQGVRYARKYSAIMLAEHYKTGIAPSNVAKLQFTMTKEERNEVKAVLDTIDPENQTAAFLHIIRHYTMTTLSNVA